MIGGEPLPARFETPVLGVFTDIDDTLTEHGRLMPEAAAALADLAAGGIAVIAVTGRPVGWSEDFIRGDPRSPMAAIVAENGAVGLLSAAAAPRGFRKVYRQDVAARAINRERLLVVLRDIEATVPGARRAADSAGRETDIAIDHSEFTTLDAQTIDQVLVQMRTAGLTATVSSIHVNAWIGDHDKASGARWIVRELWGRELLAELDRWVFVGDSTNDDLMFRQFPQSVGVANIARFWSSLVHRPRWLTRGERGVGFAEVARAVMASPTSTR